jgi:hypothetical protein
MLEKFARLGDWSLDLPGTVLVPASSRGLVGHDKKAFLERTNERALAHYKEATFDPGEIAAHCIALTATEGGGPNRNGDGYAERDCRARHQTFVKMGRVYYDHKSKDPAKSYGRIKAAWYDPDMKRIELLLALNKTAEAARRNGGLVAERMLQKLAKRGEADTSMAYKLPFDVCSWCGNKAASRKEYCTGATCGAGGCKEHLGKIVKVAGRLHHLHVDNPDGFWHDISDVGRPADPSSCAVPMRDVMAKAAGLDLGPGVSDDVRMRYALLALVEKAAELEWDAGLALMLHPSRFTSVGVATDADLVKLAQANAVGPIEIFAQTRGASERLAKVAHAFVCDAARALRHNPEIVDTLVSPTWGSQMLAKRAKTEWSLDDSSAVRRGQEALLRGYADDAFAKAAAPENAVELLAARELATDYVRYKVSALELIHRLGYDLGAAASASLARYGRGTSE